MSNQNDFLLSSEGKATAASNAFNSKSFISTNGLENIKNYNSTFNSNISSDVISTNAPL